MIGVIDFETYDPLLKKFSSGAVLKYHYPEVDFEVLGCGISDETGRREYYDLVNDPWAKSRLYWDIYKYDTWVMHNAAYDLGCLRYLYRDDLDLSKVVIKDTMLMAILVDQQINDKTNKGGYGLDNLGKFYKIANLKDSDILHDYVWATGLYQEAVKKKTGRNCRTRPSKRVLTNWCMANLKNFPVAIVGDYCLHDTDATLALYQKLSPLLAYYDLVELSDIIKLCLKMKFRGVKLDLVAARELSKNWDTIATEAEDTVFHMLGCPEDFNVNSGQKLGRALQAKGYRVPVTVQGNFSITKEWLDDQKEDIFVQLKRYRKAKKSEKDYIQKILRYQEAVPAKYRNPKIGVMFPTFKPLGAKATGRFSSGGGQGCNELNVLAISSHDKEFGAPVRKLFLPDQPNEQNICADFSNHEPRLQVHYAVMLGCPGTEKVINTWKENPKTKYHQIVADMTKLQYDVAKMVTLGLAYDMRAFGLSQKLGVSYQKAEEIIKQYHKLLPFMLPLQTITAKNLKRLGYIKTIGGRRLYIDLPYEYKGEMRTQERKAMSKLIQGSGADQLMRAMLKADKAGIKLLLCVHDELVASSPNSEEDLKTLIWAMETAYKLVVPVVADGGIGPNWGDAKP